MKPELFQVFTFKSRFRGKLIGMAGASMTALSQPFETLDQALAYAVKTEIPCCVLEFADGDRDTVLAIHARGGVIG